MMSFTQLFLCVGSILVTFATATPRLKVLAQTPPEGPGLSRRGVAYNDANYVRLFKAPGSRVTWAYNWDSRANNGIDAAFEFVPMLHSDRPDHTGKWGLDVWQAAFANRNMPTHLLGFNEPDNCDPGMGGACMGPAAAVAAWKQWIEPQKALKEKMYLGSPAVTNGANGLNYLSSFITACTGCNIDFINIHWYDDATNIAYFKKHIEDTRSIAAGRPIWITEFRARGTDDDVKKFMDEVLPWLDASKDIHRYAYFMAAKGEGLLVDNGGQGLSNIGTHYVFHA